MTMLFVSNPIHWSAESFRPWSLLSGPPHWVPIHNASSHIPGSTIPRIIHQTWRSADLASTLPSPEAVSASQSWDRLNPGYQMHVWTDDEILRFVRQEYPHALEAYLQLDKGAFKADLFRYMVLETYGGVYADIDVECLKPVDAWSVAHLHGTELGEVEVVDGLVGLALDFVDRHGWLTSGTSRQLE
jgi:hypothetical protein